MSSPTGRDAASIAVHYLHTCTLTFLPHLTPPTPLRFFFFFIPDLIHAV